MSRFIPNSFQIPNAFVDEYLDRLSGKAIKCYLLIARKTTGWHKASDRISTSQFMEKGGIKDRKTAYAAIEELEAVKLVNVKRTQGEINEFSLNFVVDENDDFVPVPKNGTSTKNSFAPVPKNGTSTRTKNWHSTKDTIKNTITNNPPISPQGDAVSAEVSRKRVCKFSDDDLKTAHWIFGLLQKLNPNFKTPNLDTWANEVRLLREVDLRSHREICELFLWANRDPFWQANILSPRKLREKWDQLVMKKSSQVGRSAVTGTGEWNTVEGWQEVI